MPRFTIRRADGKVQLDSSTMAFQLVGKGSVAIGARRGGNTTPGGALIPITSTSPTRILAVRSTAGIGQAGTYVENGQTYSHYACDRNTGTIDYWVFDIATNLAPSPGGLTLRNPATNQIVYSSDYDMLRAQALLADGDGGAKTLDPSRTWAHVQQSFAGHRYPEAEGSYYVNGQPILWDGSSYPSDSLWSYKNDGKVYGMKWDGATVQAVDISWDDVIGQLNYGSQPGPYPPNWDRPLGTVLLVDVTGL